MRFFCDVISNKILPVVRAEISRELINRYGLTQIEVAKKLGITQAAVSQYISRMRAKDSISGDLSKIISNVCNEIIRKNPNEEETMKLIWNACLELVKKEKNVFIPKEI